MTDQTTRETSPTCPECGSDAVIGPLGYRRELHCQSCWHYFQPTPTVEGSGRTEDFAATLPFRPHPSTPDDEESKGCLCGKCGGRYRVDVQVPNDLWPKIAGATELLCPRCIAEGLEAQGEFAAFRLVDAGSPTAARGVTGLPTDAGVDIDAARRDGICPLCLRAECAHAFMDAEAQAAAFHDGLWELRSAAEQGERDREVAVGLVNDRETIILRLTKELDEARKDREDAERWRWFLAESAFLVTSEDGDVCLGAALLDQESLRERFPEVMAKLDNGCVTEPAEVVAFADAMRADAARQPRQEGDR